jgi:hypothetical protein
MDKAIEPIAPPDITKIMSVTIRPTARSRYLARAISRPLDGGTPQS